MKYGRSLPEILLDTQRYAAATLHLITAWDLLRDIDRWCGKDYPNWQLLQATIRRITKHLEDNVMEAKTLDYGAIGWALNHARHGYRMRRENWPAGAYIEYDPGNHNVLTQLAVLWQPIQADLLAADWQIVDPLKPGEYHAAA